MTPRFALLLPALCLFGTAVGAQAATPKGGAPHGTPTQYTIDTRVIGPAQPVGHGSIVPATQQVDPNGMATVTITPDPGYLLTSVDACGGVDNGDGTWTIEAVTFDCTIVATTVLDSADVVFQGDLEADVRVVPDVDVSVPVNIYGASINWETGATCYGTADAPCDNNYHFRPASTLFVLGHTYLAFRWPTNDDNDPPGAARSYGVVSTLQGTPPDQYPVATALQSGDTIGSQQYFDYPGSTSGAGAWFSPDGVDAYVGFQFVNSVSGRINYGYAHLVTGPSQNGFPATITDYAYDRRGNAIVVP